MNGCRDCLGGRTLYLCHLSPSGRHHKRLLSASIRVVIHMFKCRVAVLLTVEIRDLPKCISMVVQVLSMTKIIFFVSDNMLYLSRNLFEIRQSRLSILLFYSIIFIEEGVLWTFIANYTNHMRFIISTLVVEVKLYV